MSPLEPFIRVVRNMMAKFGGDTVLSVQTGSAYNYDTSAYEVTYTTYPIRILVFDYIQKISGLGTMPNTLIESGDKQMLIKPYDGLPLARAKLDTVLYQGKKFSIVTSKEVNPSGEYPVLYELFIRE